SAAKNSPVSGLCYSTANVNGVDGGDGEDREDGEDGEDGGDREDGENERTFLVCVISVNKLSPPYLYLSNKSVKSVF
ncbi:MAG: hypothetical protein RLP02_22065, partial [Coleofasciculus sp. C2-GNP5-27]